MYKYKMCTIQQLLVQCCGPPEAAPSPLLKNDRLVIGPMAWVCCLLFRNCLTARINIHTCKYSPWLTHGIYMEIHVHSTLAKKVHTGKKGNPNPDTPYKTQGQNIHIKLSLRDTQVPSLENCGGGLKSHTCSCMYMYMYICMYTCTYMSTIISNLICWLVPPCVALRMAQAASFLVLYDASEFITSISSGNALQSITACAGHQHRLVSIVMHVCMNYFRTTIKLHFPAASFLSPEN